MHDQRLFLLSSAYAWAAQAQRHCYLFLLTGCGYSFNDSGQSLGMNSSQSIAPGDLNNDGIMSLVVANAGQGIRVSNYEKNQIDIFNRSQ